MIKNPRLGTRGLENVSQMVDVGNKYYGEGEGRQMEMIMIPKPGKDTGKVKGWRPVVLSNTMEKLVDTVVGEGFISRGERFNERPFAGRKGAGRLIQ